MRVTKEWSSCAECDPNQIKKQDSKERSWQNYRLEKGPLRISVNFLIRQLHILDIRRLQKSDGPQPKFWLDSHSIQTIFVLTVELNFQKITSSYKRQTTVVFFCLFSAGSKGQVCSLTRSLVKNFIILTKNALYTFKSASLNPFESKASLIELSTQKRG